MAQFVHEIEDLKMSGKILTIFFALTVIATSFMYANMAKAQAITEGLVSYWSFDKNTISGKTVKDIQGGHDAEIVGDTEVTAGKCHEALIFNEGNKNYISIPAEAINDLDAGTIEARVKLDSNEKGVIIAKQHDNVGTYAVFSIGYYASVNGLGVSGKAGTLYFHSKNPGGPLEVSSSSILDEGQWYHVAVTFDTSGAKLYIDGSLDGTADGDYSIPNDLSPLYTTIGAWISNDNGPWSYFNGIIDEVRIYNRVLSEAEVRHNSAKGCAVAPSDKLSFTWGEIKALGVAEIK